MSRWIGGRFDGLFVRPASYVPEWWVMRRARARRCPKCSHYPRPRMWQIFDLDAWQCRWGHATSGQELAQMGLLR